MKKVVSVLFILAIIVFSVLMVSYSSDQKPEKVLRHVVMFGFKPDVSEAQVKEVEDAFCKLPSQIDLIKGYEWGTDCSPEGLQQGLTHCFFLTFHSDADRDAYLVHPAHKAFGKVLGGRHRRLRCWIIGRNKKNGRDESMSHPARFYIP